MKDNKARELLTIYIGYCSAISCGGLGKPVVLHSSDTVYCQRMGLGPILYWGIKTILKCMGEFILPVLALLNFFFFCYNYKLCTCVPSEEEKDKSSNISVPL